MLTRKIIRIDEERCDGCGQCVPNCHEGAIQIVGGKARLVSETYCDGLGACLGHCPRGAITVEERPAAAFDEAAVERHLAALKGAPKELPTGGPFSSPTQAAPPQCPGTRFRDLGVLTPRSPREAQPGGAMPAWAGAAAPSATSEPTNPPDAAPRLSHWPIQLTLLPIESPIWKDADILLAADCVAFAMPDFHEVLLPGKRLAIACPKLDDGKAYVEKLSAIFQRNRPRSITVAIMEVPCCMGLLGIVGMALERAGQKDVPIRKVTVGVKGWHAE